MHKLWFTSDTHFGHTNVIKHDHRPFQNVMEMDNAIIENWNTFVSPNDHVWHLGDFAYRNKLPALHYLSRLKGNVHIVFGNHDDKQAYRIRDRFASHQEMAYIKHDGIKIHLSHYRLLTWRSSRYGSWHLCGHIHGKFDKYIGQPYFDGCWLDVGIPTKKFEKDRPWLWEFSEIKEIMKTRKQCYDARLESSTNGVEDNNEATVTEENNDEVQS